MLTGSHRTLNSQRPVLRRQPRVTSRLNSTVAANGYYALAHDTAPPDAQLVHTGRVRCTPDSCAESSADLQGHRTLSTGSVRCSPDPCAERVTKRPHTGRTPPDALRERPVLNPSRVKHPRLRSQRPVPPHLASGECFSERKHSRDFSKFPTGAIENIQLIFSKAPNCKCANTLLNPRNSTSFVNVPTPPSVHHHVYVC